jgi:glutathione S-transferase
MAGGTIVWVYLVNGLAFLLFSWAGVIVGRERGRSGIKSPATTGDVMLERALRVQQNTLEQLVVFVPASLLFAVLVSAPLAALLGLVWLVGRGLYVRLYMREPSSRGPGFTIAAIPQVLLMLGVVLGSIWALLQG